MTLDEMLGRMSSAEFTQWTAFAELEPFGEEREDVRFGLLICAVLNLFRGKGKKPLRPEDVMPDYGGDRARRKVRERKAAERDQRKMQRVAAEAFRALAARSQAARESRDTGRVVRGEVIIGDP